MSDTILAIDSSTLSGSVCLQHAGQRFLRTIEKPNSQAGQLVPAIESVLNEAGIWYDALNGLAATIGPGSFTGLRIGLATARAIAFAYPGIAIYAFTTLECLACGYEGDAPTLYATLRAGKGEIYVQHFAQKEGRIQALDTISIINPALLPGGEEPILGNTQELTGRDHYAAPTQPQAQHLLRAVTTMAIPADRTLKPLYIRPPDAKLPAG